MIAALLLLTMMSQGYGDVDALFRRHCAGCHNPKERKGELDLQSHATLLKGGDPALRRVELLRQRN